MDIPAKTYRDGSAFKLRRAEARPDRARIDRSRPSRSRRPAVARTGEPSLGNRVCDPSLLEEPAEVEERLDRLQAGLRHEQRSRTFLSPQVRLLTRRRFPISTTFVAAVVESRRAAATRWSYAFIRSPRPRRAKMCT